MRNKQAELILKAYNNPTDFCCYYTGQNHPAMKEIYGDWDWTPRNSVNIEPYFWNTHTIALAFGCKPVFTSEGKEWINKLITDPKQVYDINIPDVYSGRTGEILHLMKQLLDDNPEDTMIRMPDIQSPLGVAELMWDQSFYISLLTDPDAIHHLLEKITLFNIQYIQEMKKIAGKRLNAACHPEVWSDNNGFYYSDDVNSMVSPEMHLEFSINYLNKMIDELGPVIYHSCTWTEQYFENMKKIKDMKSFNWSFGTSIDPVTIMKEFGGRAVMVPHIGPGVHEEEGIQNLEKNLNSEYDLTKYVIDNQPENTAMYILFQEGLFEDIEQMKEIYTLLEKKGYTP